MWTLGYASSTPYGRQRERGGIEPLAAYWRAARGHVVAGQPVRAPRAAARPSQDQAVRAGRGGAAGWRRGRHRRRGARPAARAVAGPGGGGAGRAGRAGGGVGGALI